MQEIIIFDIEIFIIFSINSLHIIEIRNNKNIEYLIFHKSANIDFIVLKLNYSSVL